MSNVSHTLAKYSLLMVAVCYQSIRRTVHIWLVCKTFDNIYCSKLHDIPRIFSWIVLALHCYSQMWVCIRCRCVYMCPRCVHIRTCTLPTCVEWLCEKTYIDVCVRSYNYHEIPSILLSQFVLLFLASESPSAVFSNPTQLAPRDECSMYYCTYCINHTRH